MATASSAPAAAAADTADKPCAIQIVNIDPTTKQFSIDEAGLAKILLNPKVQGLPIVVVSIAGTFRKGKSFMMNFFLRYMKSEGAGADWLGDISKPLEGFTWKGGRFRNTTGIWMWSEAFVRIKDGEQVAVVLVDTQGTFDNKTTMKENAGIFALNALLSSLHVYNVPGLIEEQVLQHMHLFTKFGQMIHENDFTEESMIHKPFQSLLFLVRDWSDPNQPYGLKGGEAYLNEVLATDDIDANRELHEVRKYLRTCFTSLSCFLMPHPGMKVSRSEDFNGKIEDIDPEFVAQLRVLVPSLLASPKLVVKTVSGEKVTCAGFVDYLKTYVSLFQGGDLPEVQAVFTATARINHMNVMQDCLRAYKEKLTEICGPGRPYIQDDILNNLHQQLKTAVLDKFRKTKKLGAADFEEEFHDQLAVQVMQAYEQNAEANRHKQLLSTMRTPIVLGGLAFVCNVLGTVLSLLGLNALAVLLSYITWVSVMSIAFWLYCTYSGQMHDSAAAIDSVSKVVEDQARAIIAMVTGGDQQQQNQPEKIKKNQ